MLIIIIQVVVEGSGSFFGGPASSYLQHIYDDLIRVLARMDSPTLVLRMFLVI